MSLIFFPKKQINNWQDASSFVKQTSLQQEQAFIQKEQKYNQNQKKSLLWSLFIISMMVSFVIPFLNVERASFLLMFVLPLLLIMLLFYNHTNKSLNLLEFKQSQLDIELNEIHPGNKEGKLLSFKAKKDQ